MTEPTEKRTRFTRGGRNLILLGLGAIIIALITTGTSLAVYHNSGDIYLDRSRPGFLPDEEEIEEGIEKPEDYTFGESGKITSKEIEEYIKNLKLEVDAIDSYQKPFSANALSDQNLGITK